MKPSKFSDLYAGLGVVFVLSGRGHVSKSLCGLNVKVLSTRCQTCRTPIGQSSNAVNQPTDVCNFFYKGCLTFLSFLSGWVIHRSLTFCTWHSRYCTVLSWNNNQAWSPLLWHLLCLEFFRTSCVLIWSTVAACSNVAGGTPELGCYRSI